MTARAVYLLSAVIGFLSLSQEIIWVQAVSAASTQLPTSFGNVLAAFLLGIAAGAWRSRRAAGATGTRPHLTIAISLTAAAVGFYITFPFAAWLIVRSTGLGHTVLYLGIFLTAACFGGLLPLLCHVVATEPDQTSKASPGLLVSRVYAANIAGAVAGPLVTGFWLLDAYPLDRAVLFLSAATLVTGQFLWVELPPSRLRKVVLLCAAVALPAALTLHDALYTRFHEKLHFSSSYAALAPEGYSHIVHTRSGVAAVWPPDYLYGGGLYDGRYNLDPISDTNMIRRAYMVPTFRPALQRVLVFGLGSGSWANVIAGHDSVGQVDVVEINPGYIDLLAHFPDIARVLDDPKVTLAIDDGRRWMKRHPERIFDAIVVNGTWHWRAYASGLLSTEFLDLCKSRLTPGGIVLINATGSGDVAYTIACSFAHVVRVGNAYVASDASLAVSQDDRRQRLLEFRQKGELVFTGEATGVLEMLTAADWGDIADSLRAETSYWRVTRDNMATEYKTNGPGAWWRALPGRLYRPERAWHRSF